MLALGSTIVQAMSGDRRRRRLADAERRRLAETSPPPGPAGAAVPAVEPEVSAADLTLVQVSDGLQLPSLWIISTAAAS